MISVVDCNKLIIAVGEQETPSGAKITKRDILSTAALFRLIKNLL